MGTNPKSNDGELLDTRLVVLVTKSKLAGFDELCAALDINRSDRIRELIDADIAGPLKIKK